ncbi:MAG: hypothetical protein CMC31_05905 [Flavobacteriaceae bacterium]|nr:hypothetical protein [Flavobacteriaceae bacterium]
MNNMVKLQNNFLSVVIDIDNGGKVIELTGKKNNTSWVWFDKNNKKKFNPIQFSDYDSQWIGGYEELFPNDKVEVFNELEAPDHGELWSSSWNILDQTSSFLELQTKGYFTKAVIKKSFRLIENKLQVNYEISKIQFDEYLFKLHLAFPIENHRIEMNYDSYQKVDINSGNIVKANDISNFLSSISSDENKNDFVYFYGVSGPIQIFDSNDNACKLEYDKETLPYFWVFQTRGGWNNLNVNVLEPCNSGLKDLQTAVENNMIYIPNEDNFKTWYTIEVF